MQKLKQEKQLAEKEKQRSGLTSGESPPKIETLQKTLQDNIRKLKATPSDKAARAILRTSHELSTQYEQKLFTLLANGTDYRTNMEKELWKNCFYPSIEVLKKQSKNGGPSEEYFREQLLELINQAIQFYEGLLRKYQQKFGLDLDKLQQWPQDKLKSLDRMDECVTTRTDLPIFDSMILRSTQWNMLCLGDLHRYKIQNQMQKEGANYALARRCYMHAQVLEPMNGHPYNQLAVIACYERKWLDVLFFYLRALSVRLPFPSARESLELALNNFRGPALAYEKWIFERKSFLEKKPINGNGDSDKDEGPYSDVFQQRKNKHLQNYQEVWIHPEHAQQNDQMHEKGSKPTKGLETIEKLFAGEHSHDVQKKSLNHLLHCAGTLISSIGIEQLINSSQLALDELAAFITMEETILSPGKILKIIFLFTFPVHSPKAGASEKLIDEQRKSALNLLFGIFEILLQNICSDLDKIGLYLLTGRLSNKLLRILPSVCFLLHWVSANLHQKQEDFDFVREINGLGTNIWQLLAKFCNELQRQDELTNCSTSTFDGHEKDQIGVLLPEFAIISPYFDVIPKQQSPVYVPIFNSDDADIANAHYLVQARFLSILKIGSHLAADDNFPFLVREADGNAFQAIHRMDIPLNEKATIIEREDTSNCAISESENISIPDGDSRPVETEERELKEQLLSEERLNVSVRWVVTVRPKYIVPDTNTFIDHLLHIQRLVENKAYILLVPTIVIDELGSLTLGVPITGSTLLSREMLNPEGSKSAFVMKSARNAMDWLREMSDRQMPNMKTVTSNGNILQRLSFAMETSEQGKKRSNDDRILSVCINLFKRLHKQSDNISNSGSEMRFESTVVLLTEDRGLSVKAIAEKIPVRTIPNFTKWALFSGAKK